MSGRENPLDGSRFPVIFAAPSGAGKTSIARALGERREDVVFSISATTREPRPFERDGIDYHFRSEDEFRAMIERGELAEWALVHGNYYGTPLSNITEARERDAFLILDIDVQGSRQLRRAVPDAVSIFVLPPSGSELARRLALRGSESPAVRSRRLQEARREIQAAVEFDYLVVNDALERAVDRVESILLAESLRVARRSGLQARIDRLVSEVDDHLSAADAALATQSEEDQG